MEIHSFLGALEEIAADQGEDAVKTVEALRPIRKAFTDIPDATANNALERVKDGRLKIDEVAAFLGS